MKTFLRQGWILLPGIFLVILVALSLFPQWVTPYSFDEQDSRSLLQTPDDHHLLGTDELGRDMTSRILYGARISLSCAFLAVLIAGFFGVAYGSFSAYRGGWVDHLLMRIVDVLYAIPDLLFYILIGLFLGRDFWGLLIALSSLSWLSIARITRGEILRTKEMAYIESAHSLGLPGFRILRRHLLPQARNPILIALILRIPAVILVESTLSFLGLGLSPPHSSWGTLASEGYSALRFYPHLILYPALFIFLTILSFHLLGQWILRNLNQA